MTAREVGSSNRAGKQDIAAEDHTRRNEADVTGGVTRCVPYLDRHVADPQLVAVPKQSIGFGGRIDLESEKTRLLGKLAVMVEIGWMEQNRRAGSLADRTYAADVVYVGVGQPDRVDRTTPLGRFGEKTIGFLSRID